VLGDGRRPMRPGAAAMAGDPLAAVEDLDRGGGDPPSIPWRISWCGTL